MSLTEAVANAILAAVESHALATGHFDRVNKHEVTNAPGVGVSAEIWVQRIGVARGSGLAATSSLYVLQERIRIPATQNSDFIDPALTAAADALIVAYSGDFGLGGAVDYVDLLGENGTPLEATAGWLPQDGQMYRVYTLNLPLVLHNQWTQAP